MRILHVNDRFDQQGGVERYMLSAGELLEKRGHSNAILYRVADADLIEGNAWRAYRVEEEGDLERQIETILLREACDVAYVHQVSSAEMVRYVKQRVPTVAYIHSFQTVCPGLGKYHRHTDQACTRAFGWSCFLVHYWRQCSSARNPLTWLRLMARTAEFQDVFQGITHLVVSGAYMRAVLIQSGFSAEKIRVLPPHFLPEGYAPLFVAPRGDPVVLYAGRLSIEKGVPYLLQAFTQVPPPAELWLAGDGTMRASYEQMTADLDLGHRVRFLGWQDTQAMAQLYRRASIVVIPSIIPETFGKAGIEALSHGRPVVAFDVGAISGWLENGVDGLLVEPANSTALAKAINELLWNSSRRLQMGQTSQRKVLRDFRAEEHLGRLCTIFEEAIEAFDGQSIHDKH